MTKFIIRRVLVMIPQLFILSVLIFILAKMMPGDALSGVINSNPHLSPERIAELRQQLGLNDPWYTQYFHWLIQLFHGDLGISYGHQVPVINIIGDRIVNTFWLGVVSLILTYAIALPLGILSGRYQDRIIDKFVVGYNYLSYAMPIFVFAILMLFIFGFVLNIFPTSGSVSPDVTKGTFAYFMSKFYHLLLPAFTIAFLQTTTTIQFLRNEIIDTKPKDFVKLARSKGVPESVVYRRHILRNSMLPIAAFLGLEITGVIAGNIFIEQIFSYPGLGQLFLTSISQRDFPVVTALLMISGLLTLLGTLLSDIIISLIDPRIRVD